MFFKELFFKKLLFVKMSKIDIWKEFKVKKNLGQGN